MTEQLIIPELVQLKHYPMINERMIQDMIANDPSILKLGDLILRDRERTQPRAGRLDLLLQDSETDRRYEVEIQLGKSDESHIIRTVEYWDIERKRYPQYDHCAVLIAEDITSRFLNVVSLFNGFIPIIAIQMNAYKHGDHIALVFTKVLDEMPLGLDDDIEDRTDKSNVTNREFWVTKSNESILKLADGFCELISELYGRSELGYYKTKIRIISDGEVVPDVWLRPRKNHLTLVLRTPRQKVIDDLIGESSLDDMEYQSRRSLYRIRLVESDVVENREIIKQLLELSDKQGD